MMIDGVTIVRAEGAALGVAPARERAGEAAAWPAITLTLRSPGRTETVWAGLYPIAEAGTARSGSLDRADDQLVAEVNAAAPGWLPVADVIVGVDGTLDRPLRAWLSEVFDRYRGCAVGATIGPGGFYLVGLRNGQTVRLTPDADGGRSGDELVACASFLHVWMANDREFAVLDGATLRLVAKTRTASLGLMVLPRYGPGLPDERVSDRPAVLPQR
jgi:hypothetical protein